MKKFIAMLLVAMMALSLVACGEKPAPTPVSHAFRFHLQDRSGHGYFHERHRCRG